MYFRILSLIIFVGKGSPHFPLITPIIIPITLNIVVPAVTPVVVVIPVVVIPVAIVPGIGLPVIVIVPVAVVVRIPGVNVSREKINREN